MRSSPLHSFWVKRKNDIELNAQLTAFLETDEWAFASFLNFDYFSTNPQWLWTCWTIYGFFTADILENGQQFRAVFR